MCVYTHIYIYTHSEYGIHRTTSKINQSDSTETSSQPRRWNRNPRRRGGGPLCQRGGRWNLSVDQRPKALKILDVLSEKNVNDLNEMNELMP